MSLKFFETKKYYKDAWVACILPYMIYYRFGKTEMYEILMK